MPESQTIPNMHGTSKTKRLKVNSAAPPQSKPPLIMLSPSPKRPRENNALNNAQDALSESPSSKRPRLNPPNPSSSSLQGSDRLTSPMSSRTATSSTSSPGSSDDGKARNPVARASDAKMEYPRRMLAHRQRNREALQDRMEGDEEGDTTSSDESTSSESSSSEDSDSDSDEEGEGEGEGAAPESANNTIPHIPGQKPRIHRIEKNPDLLARVSSFLPRMKDANDSLEKDIAAGRGRDVRVDDVGDGDGGYIEMNLGLGVLEEKRDDDGSSSTDEGDSHDARQTEQPASNVLGKLMGEKKEETSKKPTIEEMNQ